MTFDEPRLYNVLKKVFLTMTFASVEIPRNEDRTRQEVMQSAIAFTGPASGRMILRLPTEIMPELARNMLAEDEDYHPDRKEQLDVLGELINVVSGAVLETPAAGEGAFQLGLPTTTGESYGGRPDWTRTNSVLWLEQGWAELTVETSPDGCGA